MPIDIMLALCYNIYSERDKGNFHSGGKKKGSEVNAGEHSRYTSSDVPTS